MSTTYNRFAGGSLERLGALSDGVFAVAMTLLVLELAVPAGTAESNQALWHALGHLWPSFAAYLLSFTMLGTFWLAQHTLLDLCVRTDRNLTWFQLGFLFVVTLLPFSARVLAGFLQAPLAIGVYWLNLLLLGLILAASCRHLRRAELVDPEAPGRLPIFRRRILFAQLLYGVAALLSLASTRLSVSALALVQAYFIVSPRLPLLDRLLEPPPSDPPDPARTTSLQ